MMPLGLGLLNTVMVGTDVVYWRLGPHGSGAKLPCVSEAGGDLPQRSLWVAGQLATGLGCSFCGVIFDELVAPQLQPFGDPVAWSRLHKRLTISTHLVGGGLALSGCFFYMHPGERPRFEACWNLMHAVTACTAFMSLHLHSRATRDLYDFAGAGKAPLAEVPSVVFMLPLRRYIAHLIVFGGLVSSVIAAAVPHSSGLYPFDPRSDPVAFLEYFWIFAMYVHFGLFHVDFKAAIQVRKQFLSSNSEMDSLVSKEAADDHAMQPWSSSAGAPKAIAMIAVVCLIFWWVPFLCTWIILVIRCPPGDCY
jgi:hypothetical protein